MKEISKWSKRFRYRKISKFVIIICFFLTVIIIGLTYYGSNVGNFLITIEESSVENMSLSDNIDFTNPVSILTAKGLKEMTNTTLKKIPVSSIENIDGINNDEKDFTYMAYTFYAKNVSKIAYAYTVTINITAVEKRVDSALRVMIIADGEKKIKAKWQEQGPETGLAEKNLDYNNESQYEVTNFISATRVYYRPVERLESAQIHKYTVIIWLEGWDAECIDNIKGGSVKMEMKFSTF